MTKLKRIIYVVISFVILLLIGYFIFTASNI